MVAVFVLSALRCCGVLGRVGGEVLVLFLAKGG